ncbi:hypothetical protein CWI37_2174p0010, partial [Hamiltosporidium tvaerminnensis]
MYSVVKFRNLSKEPKLVAHASQLIENAINSIFIFVLFIGSPGNNFRNLHCNKLRNVKYG